MMYTLIKRYFAESDEKYYAWIYLIGIAICTTGLVLLVPAFPDWSLGFTQALMDMNVDACFESIKTLLMLCSMSAILSVAKENLIGTLSINWRKWLTNDLSKRLMKRGDVNNYLHLSRNPSLIDNPSQRIQDDISLFTSQTLSLSFDLIYNLFSSASLIRALWITGGSLTMTIMATTFTVHGYLVWASIAFSVITTGLTCLIGRSLSKLTHQKQALEANLRDKISFVKENAESIALDRGETFFLQSFTKQLDAICKKLYEILSVKINLNAYRSFFTQFTMIFPYIMSAPLYFSKKISYAQLQQINMLFSGVQQSFNWFSDSYDMLAAYSANVSRVAELEKALNDKTHSTNQETIRVGGNNPNDLIIRDLKLNQTSDSTKHLFRGLSLKIKRGEHTVINGPSGLGKSTLFKTFAKTWKNGSGSINMPNGVKMYLPQDPVIPPQDPTNPEDTLKAVFAYPEPVNTYDHAQYVKVLEDCKMGKFINQLDTTINCAKLSRGEKQRISFARALLKKPDWLFLDEATASLDTPTEACMYNLLKEQLPHTTLISIAHRPTVTPFHKRAVEIKGVDKSGAIQWQSRKVGQ